MHFFERDGLPMKRCGINRFMPNSPVGVYPCREGWIGITATTPDQWKSLCAALEMDDQAADEGLATRELRFTRLDEVEQAMIRALSRRSAEEWAAAGRRHKVPMVVVPDAAGILTHPIFELRSALAELPRGDVTLKVPRTPFGLTRTPVAQRLQALQETAAAGPGAAGDVSAASAASPAFAASGACGAPPAAADARASEAPAAAAYDGAVPAEAGPLAGLTVVDFAMGWAGPLATRLLADLGADVLKIEAGRYPDWWRGVNWTPEYIEARSYEDAKPFCAMNRGKRGISVDLTTEVGRALALELISGADAVVENQAAGVMGKLGLGHETLLAHNPGLVMVSMSAFGTGNPWSDTRAYGSTLEQGAGVPSFAGFPGTQPTMYHLAYGDPVGGLFGCAAALTALHERRRSGQGQYVNLSMVEAMLQFTTPALLERQLTGAEPPRRGNRHAAMAPHGFYPAAGNDQWIAVSAPDREAFARLASAIGRPAWAEDPAFATLEGRAARHDEIDAAIATWSSTRDRDQAAQLLQEAGVAAAPLHHAQELFANAHLEANGFYIDLVREFSGPQRQGGIAIVQDGRRLGARQPAPLLGEHSREVLLARAGVDPVRYERLVREDVITFAPKGLRSTMPPAAEGAAQRRIA
jgi:crotonobetainyl-CoA:carnitine CoA-transferase CaiB-like acyl-CoA transferase